MLFVWRICLKDALDSYLVNCYSSASDIVLSFKTFLCLPKYAFRSPLLGGLTVLMVCMSKRIFFFCSIRWMRFDWKYIYKCPKPRATKRINCACYQPAITSLCYHWDSYLLKCIIIVYLCCSTTIVLHSQSNRKCHKNISEGYEFFHLNTCFELGNKKVVYNDRLI